VLKILKSFAKESRRAVCACAGRDRRCYRLRGAGKADGSTKLFIEI